jgi:predicted dehydrogenase
LEAKPGDAYENQASYFVDCVGNGRMPIAGTAAQARLAVRCAETARRSLESGAVVTL